jgi:transketolase
MADATSKSSSAGVEVIHDPTFTGSSTELETLTINTVKTLAMDAVQAANSGHPGTPMGLAPLAYALWSHVMCYDSSTPEWPDRDRFVLSCGHASMLQYALLHLSGYPLRLEDIRNFRQLGSPAAGHPEYREVAGVETTTGPLGQGIGNAVGMALAEEMLAARYNRDGLSVVDHRVWVIASDGDLMEGVAHEAASLAGHLGLHKLCVFWDDNRITIDGTTDLSFTEDTAARFAALGWQVLHAPVSEGLVGYVQAADAARADTNRPTLVVCRTHIGEGSPNKQDTSAAHGAPLGEEEIRLTKRAIGWPEDAHFEVPEAVAAHMHAAGRRGASVREAWEARLARLAQEDPSAAASFRADLEGRLPAGWEEALPSFEAGTKLATRKASGAVLAALGGVLPQLVGGSADLAGSNNTTIPGSTDVRRGAFGGRTLNFGVREHAMGSICNGLALHGGLRPYCGTFLVFSDYMRPAIRLAALMRLPVVYVFTHDSIGVGEDGPTHQPVEHVAALRAIPGLCVIRPGDAAETAEAWRIALENEGPTALCLTRQGVPTLDRSGAEGQRLGAASGVADGAYVLREGAVHPDVVLLATGSELSLSLAAADRLQKEGVTARVVSMPCWDRFAARPAAEREALFGGCAVRVGVEAGISQGWHRWIGPSGALVTLDRFGASGPGGELMEHFGFTPEHVAQVARQALAAAEQGA